MHYIRFLKSPRHLPVPGSIYAKITVTTDLGESFLQLNIKLWVEFEFGDGTKVPGGRNGRELRWNGRDGMRSLDINVPPPLPKGLRNEGRETVRMLIRPKEEEFAVDCFKMALDSGRGGVVAVRSMSIDISSPASRDIGLGVGMAERIFKVGPGSSEKRIRIWEETGESIARHIWDAGVIFSSYLATLGTADPQATSHTVKLPLLEQTLQKPKLKVLELGAGCGIVGITLATCLSVHQLLLTDLPEASEILTKNISSSSLNLSSQVLDWSLPLPPNITTVQWDLLLVADCTYNPDVVSDLVKTLKHVVEERSEVLIALAMKVRHESEMVFFELMRVSGFMVKEQTKVPVPLLGSEGEEIEIFVFALEG